MSKKTAIILNECVACGSCIKVCPKSAVSIYRGIRAAVDTGKCVGCGKCAQACPAGVITITTKEAEK